MSSEVGVTDCRSSDVVQKVADCVFQGHLDMMCKLFCDIMVSQNVTQIWNKFSDCRLGLSFEF